VIQPSGQKPEDANGAGGAAHGWVAHVVLACVGGIALAGMLMGFYGSVPPSVQPDYTTLPDTAHKDSLTTPQAVTYSNMKDARFSVNAEWKTAWPKAEDDSTSFYGSTPSDAQSREAANARRAQRRAFDGAPPVVPHAINQQNAASCLVCHGEGMKVGPVVAPKMSHQAYANCTQCHVESVNRALPPTTGPRAAATLFKGSAAPGPGERAWPGAPPTIPHTTWMRENCISCHGTLADKGLMTSHPWRSNCLQCHGLSAELDQRQPFFSAQQPPVIPPLKVGE
jgi:nitrate reductase (cytochrome), electron transfer subunit